ncbi:unnamed protein product, partial [Ixodes pacificus]
RTQRWATHSSDLTWCWCVAKRQRWWTSAYPSKSERRPWSRRGGPKKRPPAAAVQRVTVKVLSQENEANGSQRHHPGLQGHLQGPHHKTHAMTGTGNEAGRRKKMHAS